jgi:hypothetical protein
MQRAARWSDEDRYFWRFTWSYSKSYPHWAILLRSSGEEGGDGGQCTLRITLRYATLIIALPPVVRPWREKVYPKSWDEATIARLGRNWYWNVIPREYGVSYSNGFLQVSYGRASHDSRTEQRWSCFLPWTQWRHVRHSLCGLAGEHVWTESKGEGWDALRDAREACPTVAFAYRDFDGEELTATTRIEEREWHFGTGWFKWLAWFRRAKVHRSLDINFSRETGPEKGSWKGGVCGTGIDMLPGELHEAAFRRYCDDEHRSKYRKYRVTFVGPAPALNPQQQEPK